MTRLALVFALVSTPAFAGVYNSLSGNVTHDCAKDPDVAVNASEGTMTFTGTCNRIALNGSAVKMKIEAVKRLAVNGSENTVDIGGVDRLAVLGSDNKVTYKRGVEGKPKVSSLGTNNTVTQVK